MNFMKRAFLYVSRKRGKSILLFFILLILSTFVLTGLSIGSASKQAQKNLRQIHQKQLPNFGKVRYTIRKGI
jgi:putative ABC transport system permease protein